jgi:hypothetical protein
MAQILINHDDALICPPKYSGSLAQRILAGGAFRILNDLLQRTLTNI